MRSRALRSGCHPAFLTCRRTGDRIDLHIEAPALSLAELRADKPGESSATIRERVEATRVRQLARFTGTRTVANAGMAQTQIKKYSPLDPDLAAADRIAAPHLLEAIEYRSLDCRLFYQFFHEFHEFPQWIFLSVTTLLEIVNLLTFAHVFGAALKSIA